LNYLSVCSGVEAATVAWHDLGWKPVAFSEIEKFPSEVLAHHYPDVPNLGDITNYKEWNFGEKTINLVVGGTPCQSFSVAGLRKGLEDPRGNLALIFCGILDKFRPKWFVWENVPGVLSSNKGRDFGSFLTAVGELGYGYGYRVLDAQNFGVPQRRRRVFVVGHFGDWRPAAEVLFEPESLSRHIEESRKKRKDTPKDTTLGINTSSRKKITHLLHQDQVSTLLERDYKGLSSDSLDTKAIVEVFENHPADSRVKQMGDTCHSVTARWGTGGGNIPFVLNNPIALAENTIGRQPFNGGNGNGFTENGPMYTLNATGVHGVAHMFKIRGGSPVETGTQGGTPGKKAGKGYLGQDEKTYTINTTQDQHLFNNMAVRKLTPIECERLQGFSDGYTNIKENCPDGPRYKAMGNSMAVPVMRWIGERIKNYQE
jgi:DNA (cytosine-5)-methyltransferase 1|tara:strand:- start:64 stop:1347 length:1284 start_codon:yes stop_codon:yes gene_type:complete